jgi:hypothetical protein
MSPALRAIRGPITVGELTLACLHDRAANAWPVLVSELAAAGYVTSDTGLRTLWASWRAHIQQSSGRVAADDVTAMAKTVPALARTLPDDLVTRVWDAMLPVWYRPEGGYLRAEYSKTKPRSAGASLTPLSATTRVSDSGRGTATPQGHPSLDAQRVQSLQRPGHALDPDVLVVHARRRSWHRTRFRARSGRGRRCREAPGPGWRSRQRNCCCGYRAARGAR